MAVDPAFENVKKEVGLRVWRIEQMKPVAIAKEYFGELYEGDSYLVLNITQKGPALSMNLHFWLGKESSQDEVTVAAYKAVELDTLLGDEPVQFREVQGHESQAFLAIWRPYGGVQYRKGGVKSGMNHVERDKYETRLLHLKGKRNIRAAEVDVKASSLNEGDVFLLDMGLKLFLWCGKEANSAEKGKGVEMMTAIYNTRGAKAERIIMDEDPTNAEFWGALGGTASDVQPASAGGSDDDATNLSPATVFRLSDAGSAGDIVATPVPLHGDLPAGWQEYIDDDGDSYYANGSSTSWERPAPTKPGTEKCRRSMLDADDVYLIDAGSVVFVWIGKKASATERKEGVPAAMAYIEREGKPRHTKVLRIPQNGETPMFKSVFYQWDPPKVMDFGHKSSTGVARPATQKPVDFAALHAERQKAEAEEDVPENPDLKIWRINDLNMTDLPEPEYGQFLAGDCYIVQYKYGAEDHPQYTLYFWQGRDSSTMEKGQSAARTVELANKLGNGVTQCRVVQGKEPAHFSALFKGAMLVHLGGTKGKYPSVDQPRLFHVKGTTANNTKAVQVPTQTNMLNSRDCFVLCTPAKIFLWYGLGSDDDEQAACSKIAYILQGAFAEQPPMEATWETAEPDEFWAILGGKGDYPGLGSAMEGTAPEPLLMQVSDVTGAVVVTPVPEFVQDDLVDDDVMILDTGLEVFVWVGSKATDREKEQSMTIAQQYIDNAMDGRDPETPIVRVAAGQEPKMFTCHFQGWTAKKTGFVDPYQAKLDRLKAEKEAAAAKLKPAAPPAAVPSSRKPATAPVRVPAQTSKALAAMPAAAKPAAAKPASGPKKPAKPGAPAPAPGADGEIYPLEQLQKAKELGLKIDLGNREQYLSDDQFQELFGCTKEKWATAPAWKRTNLKKKHGLF